MAEKTIEQRVTIQLAVGRYIRAKDRFAAAGEAFNAACQELRTIAVKPDRFVANIEHCHYLVEVKENGDFEIEQVDCL